MRSVWAFIWKLMARQFSNETVLGKINQAKLWAVTSSKSKIGGRVRWGIQTSFSILNRLEDVAVISCFIWNSPYFCIRLIAVDQMHMQMTQTTVQGISSRQKRGSYTMVIQPRKIGYARLSFLQDTHSSVRSSSHLTSSKKESSATSMAG